MITIKISEVSSYAMTENDGIKLRNIIEEKLNGENNILLDFEGISLFATPFFNSSVGYIFLKLKDEYEKRINVVNLTELGMMTYSHSIENAKNALNSKQSDDVIGEITKKTIDNN